MTSEAKDESQPILIIDLTDEKYDGGVEIWPNYEDSSSNTTLSELSSDEFNTNNQNILDLSTSKSSHSNDLDLGIGSSKIDVHKNLNSFKFNGSSDTISAHQINEPWKPAHWQSYDSYKTKIPPTSDMPGTSYSLGPVPGSSKTLDCKLVLPTDISYFGAPHLTASAPHQASDNFLPFNTDPFEFESEEYLNYLKKLEIEFNKELDQKPSKTKKRPFTDEPTASSSLYDSKNWSNSSNIFNINEGKRFKDDIKSIETWKSSTARLKRENLDINNNALKDETSFPQLEMIGAAPNTHKYYTSLFHSNNTNFLASLNRERRLLQNDLPPGIYVKMFEDRIDLLSALIEGPTDTPYEGCLFNFDIQLSPIHPSKPPKVHYWAFCGTKLNPNLYINGKVCLSLLGTWHGNKQESWSNDSSIYQLLISIQGLVLVKEPYYNEPGHAKNNTNQEQSKCYNFQALNLVIDSIINQIQDPPTIFKDQVISFYRKTGLMSLERFEKELELFEEEQPASEKLEVVDTFNPFVTLLNKRWRFMYPLKKPELELKINKFYYIFAKFINNN